MQFSLNAFLFVITDSNVWYATLKTSHYCWRTLTSQVKMFLFFNYNVS